MRFIEGEETMTYHFRFAKALQAAAFLLARHGGSMNYMRLLKLLYIADRESLKETGYPITGDHVVAMERGPVPNPTYDLIRGKHRRNLQWDEFMERESYRIKLVKDPGKGGLSDYEVRKLEEISDRYDACDEWDMVQLTHQFPEWRKNDPGTSSRPIPIEDILEAVGRSADLAAIAQDEADLAAYDQVFGE